MNTIGFQHLRSRSLLLWGVLTVALVNLLSQQIAVVEAVFYTSLALWVFYVCRKYQINFKRLIGPPPKTSSEWSQLALVIPLILFSLGAFWVFFLPLTYLAPSLVETLLNEDVLQVKTNSQAMNIVIFVLTAIVAPIVEEVIYRGILLHRFSVKWGLQRGVIIASVLFGVVHFNLIGATAFGFVMSLLYLRSRTLLLPIACHVLNNGLVTGYGILMANAQAEESYQTAVAFREAYREPLICLFVSLPILLYYIRKHRKHFEFAPPYVDEQAEVENNLALVEPL